MRIQTMTLIVVCSILAGCAGASIKSLPLTVEDGTIRYTYILVDSGVDLAGGQRIKFFDVVDQETGEIIPGMRDGASSTGTFQDATDMSITAGTAALISGHYYAKGQEKRRPDSVNIEQSGGGAEAVSGGVSEGAISVESNSESSSVSEGASIESGAVVVDNATDVDVVAKGGQGGSTGDVEIGPVTASSRSEGGDAFAKGGNAYSESDSQSSAKLSSTNTATLTNRPSTTLTVNPDRVKPYEKHKR